MTDRSTRPHSASLIALASWLVPGGGYWLLGQHSRALTVGICITFLYGVGVLIGGVRAVEVPGWGDHGEQLLVSRQTITSGSPDDDQHVIEQTTEPAIVPPGATVVGWVLRVSPLSEIRNKPWYLAQVLVGPINLIASWGSIAASHLGPDQKHAIGYRSHSRTNELGVLYTAVAGMLNLLVIIDSASRAGQTEEQP